MYYEPKVKKRIELIVNAFRGYWEPTKDIDVVYSDKIGFIGIMVPDLTTYHFDSVESVTDFFFNQMAIDIKREDVEGCIYSYELKTYEKIRLRSQVAPYIELMGDEKDFALQYLDNFVEQFGKLKF